LARIGGFLQGRTAAKQQGMAIQQDNSSCGELQRFDSKSTQHHSFDSTSTEHHSISGEDQDWSDEFVDSYEHEWFHGEALLTVSSAEEQMDLVGQPRASHCAEQLAAHGRGYSVGDAVEIWSEKRQVWFQDGQVIKTATKTEFAPGGLAVAPGSVQIAYNCSRQWKWVGPSLMDTLLRPGRKEAVAHGRGYSVGDSVKVWVDSCQAWFEDGRVIRTTTDTVTQRDGVYPPGSVQIMYDNCKRKMLVKPSLMDVFLRPRKDKSSR